MKLKIIYGILFQLMLVHPVWTQVSVSVYVSPKTVYVQQPFHVTITVYTKTWFTAPLEFDNLQIPNTFIIPSDKPQPGMYTIDGKQYPGIQLYYIVFPYKAGDFTVPPLQITAQSPPEGSSQSRKITLHTNSQSFTVKDVPSDLKDKGTWFVAQNVALHEQWTPALKNLKTGDVIKRTITVDAKGTLPQFIPNLNEQEGLKWAATYPQEPVLADMRSGATANGRSTQTVTYLLEKAGDFTVPEINVSFWNPYTAKIETKTTQPVDVHVSENPNLGILTTLKDSLDATIKLQQSSAEHKPHLILGMKWYTFILCLIAAVLVLYIFFKLGRKIYRRLRAIRTQYKAGEAYLFRKFQKADNKPAVFLNALYCWWDNFGNKASSSVGETLSNANEPNESAMFKNYFDNALHHKTTEHADAIKAALKAFRNKKDKEKRMRKYNYLLQK